MPSSTPMKMIAVATLKAMWKAAVILAKSGCQDCRNAVIGCSNGATSSTPTARLIRLPSGSR
jgi:hypothetical protein